MGSLQGRVDALARPHEHLRLEQPAHLTARVQGDAVFRLANTPRHGCWLPTTIPGAMPRWRQGHGAAAPSGLTARRRPVSTASKQVNSARDKTTKRGLGCHTRVCAHTAPSPASPKGWPGHTGLAFASPTPTALGVRAEDIRISPGPSTSSGPSWQPRAPHVRHAPPGVAPPRRHRVLRGVGCEVKHLGQKGGGGCAAEAAASCLHGLLNRSIRHVFAAIFLTAWRTGLQAGCDDGDVTVPRAPLREEELRGLRDRRLRESTGEGGAREVPRPACASPVPRRSSAE